MNLSLPLNKNLWSKSKFISDKGRGKVSASVVKPVEEIDPSLTLPSTVPSTEPIVNTNNYFDCS